MQGRVGSSSYNGITCRYRVAYMISLLVLACMVYACVYLVLLMSLAWVLPGVRVVFIISFPFPDSHGVMGLFHLVELDCGMVLELGEAVSGKFPRA